MSTPAKPTVPTYWDYLGLAQLLELQGGLDGDDEQLVPDELLFIVVHQAFELWFKMVVRELREAIQSLGATALPETQVPWVVHHLRRCNAILKLCVDQFEVMETLTPQDFLGFRDKLVPASGFQSFQMRELEILLGLSQEQRVRLGKVDPLEHIRGLAERSPAGALAWKRVSAAFEQAKQPRGTLKTALDAWLYRTPIAGSGPDTPGDAERVDAFIEDYVGTIARLHEEQIRVHTHAGLGDPEGIRQRFELATDQARAFFAALDIVDEAARPRMRRIRAGLVFIESYRTLPLLAWPRTLVDTVVEFEEAMVLFRHRHARMVERIIGRRVGTGGSAGVEYLDRTTHYRVFADLWSVRTLLLPKEELPAVDNEAFYGFARLPPGTGPVTPEEAGVYDG